MGPAGGLRFGACARRGALRAFPGRDAAVHGRSAEAAEIALSALAHWLCCSLASELYGWRDREPDGAIIVGRRCGHGRYVMLVCVIVLMPDPDTERTP